MDQVARRNRRVTTDQLIENARLLAGMDSRYYVATDFEQSMKELLLACAARLRRYQNEKRQKRGDS